MDSFVYFLEKTWFLWWAVAVICIVAWFHKIEADAGETFAGEEFGKGDPEPMRHSIQPKRA